MDMTPPHPDTAETDPERILLDLVGKWHDGAGEGKSLIEYLGLTRDEYAAWVEQRLSDAAVVALMARHATFAAGDGSPEV
jgi:hypothetical protein